MKKIKKQIILLITSTIFALALCGAVSAQNGTWYNETIETGDAAYTSIAVDSSNNTHVSYYDETNHNLKYACNSSGTWTIETVDSTYVEGFTSLALDSSNNPHISYYDMSNGNLKYAVKSGGIWQLETVDSTGSVGLYSSLALDSSGNPHIGYFDGTNGDLKYAVKSGGAWQVETVDSAGYVGYRTSLALDSSNNPHISYTDYNYGHPNIKYVYYDGFAWQIENAILGGGGGCDESSLTLDSAGNPHISCSYIWGDGTNSIRTLKYAYKDGSGWHSEDVDTLYSGPSGSAPGSIQTYNSLALDNSGNPHISYYDPVTHSLKYTYKDNSGWHNQVIDNSAADIGKYTSLALDSSGSPHISYQGSLKYTYFVLSLANSDDSGNPNDSGNSGNSDDSGNSTDPINPVNPTDPYNPSGNSTGTVQVNAASSTTKTIEMQETGIPLNYLILAILMVINGLILPKRN